MLLICIYPFTSSCAHTFSTMSPESRHICYFFDYGALSLYSLGELLSLGSPGMSSCPNWRFCPFGQAAPSATDTTPSPTAGSTAGCSGTLSPLASQTPCSAPACPATRGEGPTGICHATIRVCWRCRPGSVSTPSSHLGSPGSAFVSAGSWRCSFHKGAKSCGPEPSCFPFCLTRCLSFIG